MAHKKTGTPRKKKTKRREKKKSSRRVSDGFDSVSDDELSFGEPAFDRRVMEKQLSHISRLMESQNFKSTDEANAFLKQFMGTKDIQLPGDYELTPLELAQEKMYEAFEAKNHRRRCELAREALEISNDCADAWVLLGEEEAESAEEAKIFFEQAVKAGERALGKEFFEENEGHFWGIMETRPYMRAKEALADVLLGLGERMQAIEHFRDMLRLNPNDNQGVRYLLIHQLYQEGLDDELEALLKQYEDDGMAEWAYTRALFTYKREGESINAKKALKEAFEANRHIPLYLIGIEKIPDERPDYIGIGDKNEAVSYLYNAIEDWLKTPNSIEWLAKILKEKLDKTERELRQEKQSLASRFFKWN